MLKKSTKKQSKMIDNEKEPELINKISPRRKESFENHSRDGSNQSSQRGSVDNISNPVQGKGGNGVGGSQNRNNLEEIVKILQKPITFQIVYTNKQANGQVKIGQQQQQVKGSTQQQSNLLNGNGYKLVQINNSNYNNSSSNNSNNSQSINESDIPKYIEQSIETGLKQLESNNLKDAIQQFRNAEVLIDTYMQSEGKVSTDLMLAVVINLGICFYKAGLFDEAYSCFENSDMRMKKKIAEKAAAAASTSTSTQNGKSTKNGDAKYSASAGKTNINMNNTQFGDSNGISVPNTVGGCISDAAFISSFSKTMKEGVSNNTSGFSSYGIEDALIYFSNLGNKLKRKRLRLSLNLQMCILFSEIGKHEDALDYAKKSSKIAIHILYDCLCICYFVLIRGNLPIANHTLHTEPSIPSSSSNRQSHTFTEPSSDTCLTLSQKLLLQFDKTNKGQSVNSSSQQQQVQQQQNGNNNGTLNNSHRRIRSEYGTPNASNKMNITFQQNNRNSSSSCDQNNQIASPVVKQRSGSTKGRILTPKNPLEKKVSSSSAYSNSNSNNNINLNKSNSFKQISENYSNLLSENTDAPTFSQDDIDFAFKCLPIFNFITSNFGALRDNFNEKIDKKARLAAYLRQIYEELISSKESDPKKRLSFILSPSQLDMHFINSKVKENHWLLTSNILNLLQMKPVPLQTISSFTPVEKEIQLESTLKKIVDSAICFYCISTETRFIEESSFLQNPNLSYKISDSEFWLGKSLEIAYTLIPQDAPMISQIINVYTRFHGVDKQIIPEEEEFPDQVKLLKPQKGVNLTTQSIQALKNNFFIPAIRTIIPKNHAQNPYIYYHSQPHATEILELYSSGRKSRDQLQTEEQSEKKQKNFQKDIPYQNLSKKVQIPKSIENHIHQHELELQNQQQNPNNQQNTNIGDSLQLEGSNTLTPLTQGSTQSQSNSAVGQSLTINSSITQNKQTINDSLTKQSSQLTEIQQSTQQKNQSYLQSKPNDTNNSSSSSEGLSYITQQMQKQQQIQLKSEEQYLNQQKYQQEQFLNDGKARSLSREKKSQGGSNNQQTLNNSSVNSTVIKDQQSILEKIEQIVKKQRPQSSSVHSSTSQATQVSQNNNSIINQNNILGASTNIKKPSYSQHHQNLNTTYNQNQQNNLILPESSNQICYSEPSTSSNNPNNRIKVSSIMNNITNNGGIVSEQGVGKSQARNIHTSPPQSLSINAQNQQLNTFITNSNAMSNNNPQQMFSLQQQLLAQAKAKKNNGNQNSNNSNNLSSNSQATSQQNTNQQKNQGHNFLKSFNQFLKQNRLQDDKKQIEPKKPQAAGLGNQNAAGPQGQLVGQVLVNPQVQQQFNQIVQNSQIQQQLSQQNNNNNQLNVSNGPITSEMLAAKKIMKQNFFENHRPSLPEQFGLSAVTSQIQSSQSTKNSSNPNNANVGSISKSFNYNILKQQQSQQQNPSNNFSLNKNILLNNENLMPVRHQSEPHNALKIQPSDPQSSLSSNIPLGVNKQSDNNNNYHFSVLLNNQIRQNSQEKEQVAQQREKKLSSFKQGDIQINTNFIYLPNSTSGGSSSTTANTNASLNENSLLPQENFLRQLELNNYSLKHQQKRNFSASNKSSSSNNNNANNTSAGQYSYQNNNSTESQPMVNNFLSNNSNQQSVSQQMLLAQQQLQQNSASTAPTSQLQQSLLSSFASQSGKQQSFMQTQNVPQTSTVIQNNIVFQQSTPLDQKSQKVNTRQLHKRKMVSNNIQFNEKFNHVSVKSPSNYPSLQSPSNNFQSIVSTTKSSYAKTSMPGSTQLQTKIQFPLANSQVGQPSNSSSSTQQRKDSAQRKRRIKTDSYDAGTFNSFDIDNKLRSSFERAHSNQQNTRMKTQN